MAELQAEAQGEKPESRKELFPAKRAAEAPSSVIETKRAKKWQGWLKLDFKIF